MEPILSIEINNNKYDIFSTEIINDDNDIMGYTIFIENKIFLKKMKHPEQIIRTLKHELTHVWLYEYGHNQHDENKTFNYEDVCEIVACSNDWINSCVKEYEDAISLHNI